MEKKVINSENYFFLQKLENTQFKQKSFQTFGILFLNFIVLVARIKRGDCPDKQSYKNTGHFWTNISKVNCKAM